MLWLATEQQRWASSVPPRTNSKHCTVTNWLRWQRNKELIEQKLIGLFWKINIAISYSPLFFLNGSFQLFSIGCNPAGHVKDTSQICETFQLACQVERLDSYLRVTISTLTAKQCSISKLFVLCNNGDDRSLIYHFTGIFITQTAF